VVELVTVSISVTHGLISLLRTATSLVPPSTPALGSTSTMSVMGSSSITLVLPIETVSTLLIPISTLWKITPVLAM
jgi:hypothetical protein